MADLQILNPVAQSAGKNNFHAAARVLDLSAKTIGLYNNSKPGGDVAEQRIIEQLNARFGHLQFRRFSGSMGRRTTLAAVDAQVIAKECDAVIGIRGD